MRRSKKLVGSDAIEILQKTVIEMLSRTNCSELRRLSQYLDSSKATTTETALLLTCLYSKLSYEDDLELNALFQEAFALCGQAANDYKSLNDRLKAVGV